MKSSTDSPCFAFNLWDSRYLGHRWKYHSSASCERWKRLASAEQVQSQLYGCGLETLWWWVLPLCLLAQPHMVSWNRPDYHPHSTDQETEARGDPHFLKTFSNHEHFDLFKGFIQYYSAFSVFLSCAVPFFGYSHLKSFSSKVRSHSLIF